MVILTTSKADEDIYRCYDLGVNSYIVKPVTFEALVDILQTLEKYWFEIVELPEEAEAAQITATFSNWRLSTCTLLVSSQFSSTVA